MAQPASERGTRQVAAYIEEETAEEFAALARRNNRTVSDELRHIIGKHLARARAREQRAAAG